MSPGSEQSKRAGPRAVLVRVERGTGTPREVSISSTVTVGSDPDCDIRFSDAGVAPRHVQIVFDGILWWARDLGSPTGTFLDGSRIQFVPLPSGSVLELGQGGPSLSFGAARGRSASVPAAAQPPASPGPSPRAPRSADPAPQPPRAPDPSTQRAKSPAAAPQRPSGAAPVPVPAQATAKGQPQPQAAPGGDGAPPQKASRFSSETQIVRALQGGGAKAGRETLMLRAAFARVQKGSTRKYRIVLAAAAIVLVLAGVVIAFQWRKIHNLRATAERLFYSMRTLELQASKLEDVVLLNADPRQVAELKERRSRVRSMEKEYDAFVRELGVYDKLPKDEQVILRVARAFGECEVNVPKGFIAEVRRYIERYRSSDRLPRVLQIPVQKAYSERIARAFAQANLPPQFIYLAAQESGYDDRAVGRPTRYGHAKGMWQFIASTARRYGLRVGPLQDQGVYDPQDERFNWEKASVAAARYLKDLHDTDAQASGLLAMACYNWGEDNVRGIIQSMPENPQERNFWRLLANKKVPRETYDYVLSIFSVAVICEDPALFGFDLKCPLPPAPAPTR